MPNRLLSINILHRSDTKNLIYSVLFFTGFAFGVALNTYGSAPYSALRLIPLSLNILME